MLGCSQSRRPRKLWPPKCVLGREGVRSWQRIWKPQPWSTVCLAIHLFSAGPDSPGLTQINQPNQIIPKWSSWSSSWPGPLATWSSLSPAPRPQGWSVRLHESQSWQSPLNPFINLIWFNLIFFLNYLILSKVFLKAFVENPLNPIIRQNFWSFVEFVYNVILLDFLAFFGILPIDWLCSAPISERFTMKQEILSFLEGSDGLETRQWWASEFWGKTVIKRLTVSNSYMWIFSWRSLTRPSFNVLTLKIMNRFLLLYQSMIWERVTNLWGRWKQISLLKQRPRYSSGRNMAQQSRRKSPMFNSRSLFDKFCSQLSQETKTIAIHLCTQK